jgi:hypothetical protein
MEPVSLSQDLPGDVTRLQAALQREAPSPEFTLRSSGLTSGLERRQHPRTAALSELVGLPELSLDSKPIEVAKLDRWAIQTHVYSSQQAGNVGFLAGLFGGSGKRVAAGAMDEAKRYRVETTDAGRRVEVGVAVRLQAATTEWDARLDISLPNIAAAAQLQAGSGDARVTIDVLGYTGPLGDLLPAPKQLDVTTLAEYLAAFARIQALVFGEAGLAFASPTVLSYDGGDDAARPAK